MDWLLKIVAIWLSLDILIIATSWYVALTIKQFWPEWWQRVVVAPYDQEFGFAPPEL